MYELILVGVKNIKQLRIRPGPVGEYRINKIYGCSYITFGVRFRGLVNTKDLSCLVLENDYVSCNKYSSLADKRMCLTMLL